MIDDEVIAKLKSINSNVYSDWLPDRVSLPSLVVYRVSSSAEKLHDGGKVQSTRFQVDVLTESAAEMRNLAEGIEDEFDGTEDGVYYSSQYIFDTFEPQTKVYKATMEIVAKFGKD